MNANQKQRLEKQLLDAVDQYRSMVLDPVEQELGHTACWPHLRRRLLKVFGDRGLSSRVQEILDLEFKRSNGG